MLKKFYQVHLILFVAAQPWLLSAQSRSKKVIEKEDVNIQKNLRYYIGALADDSMEGRRAGTPGEIKAANFLVSQYQQLGIPSFKTGYLQPFEIDEGKILTEDSKVILNDKSLTFRRDFFPLVWSGTGKVDELTAVALHEQGAAWWLDLKEVVENNANNRDFLAEKYIKEVAKDAAEKGATALLLYNSGTRPDSLRFNAKDKADAVKIPVIYFTKNAIGDADIDASSSPAVDIQLAFKNKVRTAHNVVAWIDNKAANTVVIGAHFDHLGMGEDRNSRFMGGDAQIHNGADDNASGTAAVLELARLIKEYSANDNKKKKKKNTGLDNLDKRNYVFVHFSGEELGLYGSKYFVENPLSDIGKISYMVNMDMIGRLNGNNALTVGGLGTSPQWASVLPDAAPYSLSLKIDSSGAGPSDYASFYNKKIPVLFFFTNLHSDYHMPTDDADKINYAGETTIIDFILETLDNAAAQSEVAFKSTTNPSMTPGTYKVSVGIMPDYTFSGQGVRADAVIADRPAKKAGMEAGDVIIQLGSFEVTGMDTYMQALNKFDVGQSTTVTVKRGNDVKSFPITFQ